MRLHTGGLTKEPDVFNKKNDITRVKYSKIEGVSGSDFIIQFHQLIARYIYWVNNNFASGL